MIEEKQTYSKKYHTQSGLWGTAINRTIEREDGTLWVGNSEYLSQVCFCPITGYEAKVKPEIHIEDLFDEDE